MYCIINNKAFHKKRGVYLYNQWNYFQCLCIDEWWSGDISIQTWCIPLEAFASKNDVKGYFLMTAVGFILLTTC